MKNEGTIVIDKYKEENNYEIMEMQCMWVCA